MPIPFHHKSQIRRRSLAGATKEDLWSLSTLESFFHKMFYASSMSSHLLFICLLPWNCLLSSLKSISLPHWFSTRCDSNLRGHLIVPGNSFDCHIWLVEGRDAGQPLQWLRQLPQQRIVLLKMSIVLRLRNPGLILSLLSQLLSTHFVKPQMPTLIV